MRPIEQLFRQRDRIRFGVQRILLKRELLQSFPGAFAIATHLTENERVLLYKLATELPPGAAVVEVGSYVGASTFCLAAGVRRSGGRVFAVDTWANDAMSEGPRDTYREFLANIRDLEPVIQPLRGLSHEVATGFEKRIDLLFIDGDHDHDAVRRDLDCWLPKTRPGTVVVFHDYGWAPGVRDNVHAEVDLGRLERGKVLENTFWSRVRTHTL